MELLGQTQCAQRQLRATRSWGQVKWSEWSIRAGGADVSNLAEARLQRVALKIGVRVREAGGTGLKLMGPPERWGAVVLAQMLKHNGHLRRDQDGLKNPQGARRRSAG